MKFLCLAGLGTNPETLQKQLLPIIQDLERDGEHSFHCMAGSVELAEFAGLEEYFGPAPHLRFLESGWPGATNEQLYEAIGSVPGGLTPENIVRYLQCRLPPTESPLLLNVLIDMRRKFQEEGPFDCILGHSEGAIIAATFVVDILKKSAEADNIVPPKCAVFLNGGVPHTADGKGWVLADECGQVITIPTCHIMAHNDPTVDQAIALYHLCNEDLASMVDHGRGHAIPRDDKSCKLMGQGIRDLIGLTNQLAKVEDVCND